MRFYLIFTLFLLALSPSQAANKLCKKPNRSRLIRINPPTILDPTPFGYAHIELDTKNAVAHIAGQVAFDLEGNIVGTTLAEQLAAVEKNLRFAMDAVGATEKDIMKLNGFIVNFDTSTDLATFQVTGRNLGSPVSTVVGVPTLVIEGLLVEIEIDVAVRKKMIRKIQCS